MGLFGGSFCVASIVADCMVDRGNDADPPPAFVSGIYGHSAKSVLTSWLHLYDASVPGVPLHRLDLAATHDCCL